MSRRARLVLSDVPLHVIQRGHNRQDCFFTEADRLVYLDLLRIYTSETGCQLHAYVLMTNHVHLLLSPLCKTAPGRLMKALGQRYAQYINRRQARSGTLWAGRFRSCVVDEAGYLMTCQRYIELNPVRAQMVDDPGDYRWSSYRANALGHENALLTPHALYTDIASDPAGRQSGYRALFHDAIAAPDLLGIRHATNGNYALGDADFIERVGNSLQRTVEAQRGGRPGP